MFCSPSVFPQNCAHEEEHEDEDLVENFVPVDEQHQRQAKYVLRS